MVFGIELQAFFTSTSMESFTIMLIETRNIRITGAYLPLLSGTHTDFMHIHYSLGRAAGRCRDSLQLFLRINSVQCPENQVNTIPRFAFSHI